MNDLRHAAVVTVRDCLGLQSHETLLVVTNPSQAVLARALANAAQRLARETLTIEYRARKLDGQEPPEPVPHAMTKVDVVLAITQRSITHTAASRAALASGARLASMPGIGESCMVRTMNANYREIARRAGAVATLLTNARTARLTTRAGTDFTLPVDGVEAVAATGLILDPGEWGELPAGVATLRPRAGTGEGVVVIDGSLPGICRISDPVRVTVRDGVVVAIDGGAEARLLRQWLEQAGASVPVLTVLGVGTNDRAIVSGDVIEDAKALGTVHLGFGFAPTGQESLPVQLPCVVMEPTLTLDGKPLLECGNPGFS